MIFRRSFQTAPLIAWKIIATMIAPALKPYLQHRSKKGKEIQARISERMGYASLERKPGELIHFHAASVGEVISIFPIIEELHKIDPHVNFLITTGTVTSFHIVQQQFVVKSELSRHIQHQFVPLDVPKWVNRFVHFWHPSLSIIVESELWPNLIDALHRYKTPLALINARLSDRSFNTWNRFQKTAQILLTRFDWIAARSAHDQNNFEKLGVKADYWGDIKQIAPELPYDVHELSKLQAYFQNKPVWLAASTHDPEEVLIIEAHNQLRKQWPELVTIIVPRHPERRQTIIEQCGNISQRSLGQLPDEQGLWICDTLGELGLFYRLCDIAFIGNSLDAVTKGGGHNPFEPAKLNCVLATGNKIHNFEQAFALLGEVVTTIPDVNALVVWVDDMLRHVEKRQKYAVKTYQIVDHQSQLAKKIATQLYQLKASTK